ncbi:MAG: peptidoglycan endopeptidase, partial [Comamonadaceae bacterium]
MRFFVLLSALLFAYSVHAAPQQEQRDEMHALLADRGLITQLDHVRQAVTDRTTDLVSNALGFLGVPYRRGGTSADTGFDCSGFVRAMYTQTVGLLLPRRAEEQAAATLPIDRGDMKPGDLVFFNTMRRTFSHVGIYLGEGKFIHSPRSGAQVRVEDLSTSYWQRRFNGARRVDSAAAAIEPEI